MPRVLFSVGLAGFSLLLVSACSLQDVLQLNGNAAGNDNRDGGDNLNSTVTAGQSDTLGQRFPGCGAPENVNHLRDQVWQLLNNERTRNGLDPLARNDVLDAEAEQYACEMIYYDFFAHVNPVTGSDLAARAASFEYDYWMIGENLAAGQTTPEQAVTDWMNSPGHRENMLQEDFTEVGVGLREGGDYGLYWVLEFGNPQ